MSSGASANPGGGWLIRWRMWRLRGSVGLLHLEQYTVLADHLDRRAGWQVGADHQPQAVAGLDLAASTDDGLVQDELAPEQLAARLAEVTARTGEQVPQSGAAQGTLEVQKAMAARG